MPKKNLLLLTALLPWLFSCQSRTHEAGKAPAIPANLRPYVEAVEWDSLGENKPSMRIQKIDDGVYRIHLDFDLQRPLRQDDWQIRISPSFEPEFHWAPHLTPEPGNIIDQHVFRSPALITCSKTRLLAVVPDLDIMKKIHPVRWYMDLNAPDNQLTLGMSDCEVTQGLFFNRKPGASYPAGKHEFGFYVFISKDRGDLQNPWRWPLAFLWENWGMPLFESEEPLSPDLDVYVKHTYHWALQSWAESVWQEFETGGSGWVHLFLS